MRDSTQSKILFWAVIAIMIFLMTVLGISICRDIWGKSLEVLVNEYPFWAEDSTFQTVQIIKCWELYPNGQRKLLGYMVTVDSAGCRIHEEESVWFLNWATWDALRLRSRLAKQKGD